MIVEARVPKGRFYQYRMPGSLVARGRDRGRTQLHQLRSEGHMRIVVALALLALGACATAPSDQDSIDVLDYVIGQPQTWPRFGPMHSQHQNLEADRVCWTKYALPWSYECWKWDSANIYHAVDHAIDGNRRWEHYIFSDGRWLPRRLVKGETWSLVPARQPADVVRCRLQPSRRSAGAVSGARVARGVDGCRRRSRRP